MTLVTKKPGGRVVNFEPLLANKVVDTPNKNLTRRNSRFLVAITLPNG